VTKGRVRIWTAQPGFAQPALLQQSVRELESAGFASIWIPESTWVDPFVVSALVLSATERLSVCPGVARVHGRAPQTMVNAWSGLSGAK
jgi:alkanesulfonate monooxygenase SsuD/methylene tetrahydromethanopterin reductase-like flavin-dependent oxidoreductase (luciferase family)